MADEPAQAATNTQTAPSTTLRNWSSVLTQPAPARKPVPAVSRPVVTVVTGAAAAETKKDDVEAAPQNEGNNGNAAADKPKRFSRPSLAEQQQPKRTILVLDSGAIIKGVRVERLGSEFWTIKEVIDEIRDSKARDFLQTFPYEIKTTEPDPQDMKAVIEFAKKTGDYASLSVVDMKVIALTRTFEREHNGVEHLRTAPLPPTLVPINKKPHGNQPETQAQWGASGRGRGGGRGGGRGRGGAHPHPHPHPHPHSNGATDAATPAGDHAEEKGEERAAAEGRAEHTEAGQDVSTENIVSDQEKEERTAEQADVKESEEEEGKEAETRAAEEAAPAAVAEVKEAADVTSSSPAAEGSPAQADGAAAPAPQEKPKKKRNKPRKPAHADANANGDSTQPNRSHPSSRRNSTTPAPPKKEEDDDDGGGWITPDNIGQMKRSAARIASLDDLVRRAKTGVACITTDYAMQNVLIQMGLHLLSTDGMVIKRLRTYLLQCHACFKTTKEMEKVFCPNCGHQTLRKVPYTLDERTGQPILLANRVSRPVSARGTKFSLPLPKGGRHEQKLILREDELLEKTRRKKKNKDGEDDAFDEDRAFLQPRQQSQAKFVVGKARKNPNESRRRTGKRKKNSGALN